jgi:hypothetical protein
MWSWTPTSSMVCRSLGYDDHQGLAVAPVRHEAIPQHHVGRDAPKQLLIRVKVIQVDELELIARCQKPRPHVFGRPVDGQILGLDIQGFRLRSRIGHD